MFDRFIKSFIVRYAVNKRFADFTHEWIYVKKKQQFLAQNKSAKFFENRNAMYDWVIKEELGTEPVMYLEFGVFMGESLRYWTEHHKNPDSKFYGFDTFTGLPEDWTKNKPKGSYSSEGKIPVINDKRVGFEVGLFNQTLFPFIETKFTHPGRTVIHLDADLYSSTMYVLSLLLPHLKKNDILIFDEFGNHLLHEFKAFLDFRSFSGKEFQLIASTKELRQAAFKIG